MKKKWLIGVAGALHLQQLPYILAASTSGQYEFSRILNNLARDRPVQQYLEELGSRVHNTGIAAVNNVGIAGRNFFDEATMKAINTIYDPALAVQNAAANVGNWIWRRRNLPFPLRRPLLGLAAATSHDILASTFDPQLPMSTAIPPYAQVASVSPDQQMKSLLQIQQLQELQQSLVALQQMQNLQQFQNGSGANLQQFAKLVHDQNSFRQPSPYELDDVLPLADAQQRSHGSKQESENMIEGQLISLHDKIPERVKFLRRLRQDISDMRNVSPLRNGYGLVPKAINGDLLDGELRDYLTNAYGAKVKDVPLIYLLRSIANRNPVLKKMQMMTDRELEPAVAAARSILSPIHEEQVNERLKPVDEIWNYVRQIVNNIHLYDKESHESQEFQRQMYTNHTKSEE